jgi:hypothetical protein
VLISKYLDPQFENKDGDHQQLLRHYFQKFQMFLVHHHQFHRLASSGLEARHLGGLGMVSVLVSVVLVSFFAFFSIIIC